MMPAKKLVVICGPTASGKSGFGLELARALNGEIVSCDSVQVYRGFNIGAAKATEAEQREIPHHLLDVVDCSEEFDARAYGEKARAAIEVILHRGKVPIVVGGSGLYLRALWEEDWHEDLPKDEGLRDELAKLERHELLKRLAEKDPERAASIHPNDRYRLTRALEIALLTGKPLSDRARKLSPLKKQSYTIVLRPPRALLHQRIADRVVQMMADGLLAEVETLIKKGCSPTCKPMQSIGYKQAAACLRGELSIEKLPATIIAATRQYAKRQDTWFRKVAADALFAQIPPVFPFAQELRGTLSI